MGKRYLKTILNTPYVNIDVLQNIYDITELLMNEKIYENYQEKLILIGDIEKIFRKMLIGLVQPNELYIFIQSFQIVGEILHAIDGKLSEILEHPAIEKIEGLLKYFSKLFVVEKLCRNTENEFVSYYGNGVHPELDTLYENINERINFIENLRRKLSSLIGNENMM